MTIRLCSPAVGRVHTRRSDSDVYYAAASSQPAIGSSGSLSGTRAETRRIDAFPTALYRLRRLSDRTVLRNPVGPLTFESCVRHPPLERRSRFATQGDPILARAICPLPLATVSGFGLYARPRFRDAHLSRRDVWRRHLVEPRYVDYPTRIPSLETYVNLIIPYELSQTDRSATDAARLDAGTVLMVYPVRTPNRMSSQRQLLGPGNVRNSLCLGSWPSAV